MDLYWRHTLVFFLVSCCLSPLCDSQAAISCGRCQVGETCAMVRNGNGEPTPGCINMQEAIMLARALEGSPTGPGTGTGGQSQAAETSTHFHTHETPNGLESHSHGLPVRTSGRQFDQSGFGVERGFGSSGQTRFPMSSMFSRQLDGRFRAFGMRDGPLRLMRNGFVPMSAFPSETVINSDQRFDPIFSQDQIPGVTFAGNLPGRGGHTIEEPARQTPLRREPSAPVSTHWEPPRQLPPRREPPAPVSTHWEPPRQLPARREPPPQVPPRREPPRQLPARREPARREPPPQVPPRRVPPRIQPPRNTQFQGESSGEVSSNSRNQQQTPTSSGGSGSGNNQSDAAGPPVVSTLVPPVIRPERQGQVSNILRDESGNHYMFFPRADVSGIRVNISKTGFCRRNPQTRERNFCMNMCYADRQCPRDLKCCPSGCSLSCLDPNFQT